MSENRRKPFYLDVDGFIVSGGFSVEAVRSVIRYKPRPGDLFIVTFPKCGTTWTQQIVSLIFDRGVSVKNYMEFNRRSPFLEMCGVEAVDWRIKPGAMKLHTPYHLTPQSPEAKYICVVRNPKDTVVSFFHHTRNSSYKFEDGTFDEFFEVFMNGENDFGEYFDHILSWYEHRNDPNVFFFYFENLKRDKEKTIKAIARFMGKQYEDMLTNEPQVLDDVLKHSSLEHMKILNNLLEAFVETGANDAEMSSLPSGLRYVLEETAKDPPPPGESFDLVRKGNVGDWRSVLSVEQLQRLDEKIEEKLKGTEMYDFWKETGCI